MRIQPDWLLQQQLTAQVDDAGIVAVRFEYPSTLPQRAAPAEALVALYEWHRQEGKAVATRFLVTDCADEASLLPKAQVSGLDILAQRLSVPLFELGSPALLEPVTIPKAWGQEIWFTGIEERGVSRIGDGRYTVPLPWYLYAAPGLLANNRHESINLLKILDPLPDPLLGDLYFELHEQKQEIYVVTHVDRVAWPDGRGAIRLGFDPEVRRACHTDDAFRARYRDAVMSYREIRQTIDELIDRMRAEEGIALDEPAMPAVQQRWLGAVPETLRKEEQTRRAAMNAFTQLWPLQVGDVVQVPLLTPHALQHGVRTVEFQTPVYERKILSFGQKVLTQPHWDTATAISRMVLDVGGLSRGEPLASGQNWQLERIVTFDDFTVDRLTIDAGGHWVLEADGEYGVVMAVGAQFSVGSLSLAHEQACFIPAQREGLGCKNESGGQGVLLIARPC